MGFEVKAGTFATSAYSLQEDGGCSVKTDGTDLPPPFVLNENLKADEKQEVVWSYGVRFEPSDIAWASRWDTYLAMTDVNIHWFSITNSFVTVLILSTIFGVVIVRTLSRDIAQYNDQEDDDLEPTGWKLVHGDVLRPPPHPELFCAVVGTGLQLLAATACTIAFALLGTLSPSSRGALMTCCIVSWLLMGLVGGYYSSRVYKTIGGLKWKHAALLTATLFPGTVFLVAFALNFLIWGEQSSGAVPFTTMVLLLVLWFLVSVPLVLLGSFFGYRMAPYPYPVKANQIPRQIPEKPWYLQPVASTLLAGLLPFGAMFIELYFIMTAIWENQFYYMFGFLVLVVLVMVIACSEIAIVTVYMLLCAEDWRWWWQSLLVSGGCAIYVLLYSAVYFMTKLEVTEATPTIFFFGYSFLMSLAVFCLTSAVGFSAAFMFVRRIYGAVKID